VSSPYIYDPAWEQERERLAALEGTYDDVTIRRLEALGVTEGWHCLEVGGGAGSIARWLASRVRSQGYLVVTDLDTKFLDGLRSDRVEVRRHDVGKDDLEHETFDLVHARAVLQYVANPEEALGRLVASLRPGGWLLWEDLDVEHNGLVALEPYARPPELGPLTTKGLAAFAALVKRGGGNVEASNLVAGRLIDAGLEDVDAELTSRLVRGGSARAAFPMLSLQQLRSRLGEISDLTDAEAGAAMAHYADPKAYWMSLSIVGAWGRRPVT
jgi:ubiquinone/menaquinone biosynthesis C-methylase UbiE